MWHDAKHGDGFFRQYNKHYTFNKVGRRNISIFTFYYDPILTFQPPDIFQFFPDSAILYVFLVVETLLIKCINDFINTVQ